MAKTNSTKPPSYRLHRASGQAVVTIARKDHYLGVYGTPESRLRYERLISAWMQGNGAAPLIEPDMSTGLTVAELCAQYLRFASSYYVKGGQPTSELTNVKRTIRTVRELYASLPAKDFGPLKLKAVRQRFIEEGLARSNCNRFARNVIRIFSWGAENELVPATVMHGLREVKALAKGRCEAPETDPVGPVSQADIDAALEHLSPMLQAMVRLQLLLACRPGELVTMRPRDIDRSGAVWVYVPTSHKTEHKGKSRIIPIGPRAQLVLAPWMAAFPDVPIWRSQRGKPFTVAGYATAIRRACDLAGIPSWSPNQLRHSGATRIRQQTSLDAAQIILGHSNMSTTEVYAEKNLSAALRIAAEVG